VATPRLTLGSQSENIVGVHVISRKRLREFAAAHPDSEKALDAWYRVAKTAKWMRLLDVQQIYPAAEAVGRFTVFNIRGNHYRLITVIHYPSQTIFVRAGLTHAEYDKDRWKDE
jgi:mRNA interferase HigB